MGGWRGGRGWGRLWGGEGEEEVPEEGQSERGRKRCRFRGRDFGSVEGVCSVGGEVKVLGLEDEDLCWSTRVRIGG